MAPNFKVVEKTVRDLINRGMQSSTYFEYVRYPEDVFLNDYHRGLAILKNAEAYTGIMEYRSSFVSQLKCRDEKDYFDLLEKITEKVKMGNCGEAAQLVYLALKKLGIPCRIVKDDTLDHVFVVVNRTTPFTDYKKGKSGEFVADLWLKKVYKSVEEAYVDFKRLFGITRRNKLEDITDKPYKFSLLRPLTKEERERNEKVLEDLFENIDILRKEVRAEARGLKYSTSHIQGRTRGQLKHTFYDDFEEILNRAALRKLL